MAEYIEREAAIEFARLHYCKDCNNYNGVLCRSCAFDDGMLLIEDAQAADVVEVRHGEWNDNIIGFCNVCMECGAIVERTAIKNKSGELNYCPNCGAKMDGKGER